MRTGTVYTIYIHEVRKRKARRISRAEKLGIFYSKSGVECKIEEQDTMVICMSMRSDTGGMGGYE